MPTAADGEPTVREIDPADPRVAAVIQAYAYDLAETIGFPLESVHVDDLDNYRRPGGVFLIVEVDDHVAGCAAMRTIRLPDGAAAAEIKRMWLRPDLRGRGLGAELLVQLHDAARGMGHTRAVLDSRRELRPAMRLYASAGYREIDPVTANPDASIWMLVDL
jgi:GNAT superfamily N-acetyltransferase